MHDPREPHLQRLKRVRALLSLSNSRSWLASHMVKLKNIIAYSDADWAGCLDTCWSTSDYYVYLGDNLVASSSKQQPMVSRSSTAAEYRAMANVISETLAGFVNSPSWIVLHAELLWYIVTSNVGATYLASNSMQDQRIKHVVDLHFVRKKISLGELKVLHIPSMSQFADIFTQKTYLLEFCLTSSKTTVRHIEAAYDLQYSWYN